MAACTSACASRSGGAQRGGTLEVPPGASRTGIDAGAPPLDATPLDGASDIARTPDGNVDGRATGPLPNLTINADRVRRSASFEVREFGAHSCDIQEGCLARPGRRRLLRFDLETPNDGIGDAYIGHPTRDDPRFEWSTCHGHRHFLGYARFGLLDRNGAEVAHGHKQSFCLMDSNRTGRVPSRATARFTCDGDQGIQAGWSDVYERNLDCQYIDVTDVAPGTYRIHVEVNISRGIEETRYDDNAVDVEINITPQGDAGVVAEDAGAPGDALRPCTNPTSGLDRECGWTRMGAYECTPGSHVQVACNAGCGAGLGTCTGDPMLRVCEGVVPSCTHITMLGQNDDSCPVIRGAPNACPSVTIDCPRIGRYTVLTGPYQSAHTATCVLGTH